ncbi:MAG: ADP-ribosylglycohydrolase family protein [Erysipelotrichaceae bacterium]|nr:ADP-ribosylglycohydrolase family protein [Erysipelotrichaceae bacterium]
MYDLYDRVLGCFTVSGMGDAFGAATEAMSMEEIHEIFGGRVTTFVRSEMNKLSAENKPGEITDDTSQMVEMIKAIIKNNGELTPETAGEGLLSWSENWPNYYPRCAGPTTRVIIDLVKQGKSPVEVAKEGRMYYQGTTNGAIMRIAGAGAIHPGDWDGAIKTGIAMTACSHGTQIAYSAAGCISAAIAEAMKEGSDVHSVLKAAIYGCKKGEEIGLKEARHAAGARVLPKVLKAIEIAYEADNPIEAEKMLNDEMGIDSAAICQSCAIAIGLFAANDGDPIGTITSCANIGGDTDTIGCVAGAVAGAFAGYKAIPEDLLNTFEKANPDLHLNELAKDFVRIIENR